VTTADDSGRLVLLCGLPGSGKTTVARQLERDLDAVRFCPDEWMAALGIDLFDQTSRARIEAIQWELAQRLLRCGAVVVIEWGLWSRTERDALHESARELGVAVELRYLAAPLDVLWQRVQGRGTDPASPDVALTYEHLVEYEAMFDPPDDAELAGYDA
jgi:predicted kinase